jgi:hypothetical protein
MTAGRFFAQNTAVLARNAHFGAFMVLQPMPIMLSKSLCMHAIFEIVDGSVFFRDKFYRHYPSES